jgi:VanZ family protein
MALQRHRSSASPLALVYAVLVLYASLYPFAGWRWPPGQMAWTLAALPRTSWQLPFDIASNLLGYLPLGALLMIAMRRSGVGRGRSLLLAIAGPGALSYATEVLQHVVPGRVPALEDFLMNTTGAAAGALLAHAGHALGLVEAWHAMRQRWFVGDSAGALALLALWPVGLLFPTPIPLGLGQVGERLREALAHALAGVAWAGPVHQLLASEASAATPLRPVTEAFIMALGLLSPCLLAFSVMVTGWRRVAMGLGALLLGLGGMTLSTALNFGPGHALGWLSPAVLPGLGLGLLLALGCAQLRRSRVAGLGLMALTGLVVGVAQAPADPYFAQSLQAWEQGRFVRFHGLAQWVGWLWPYAAMAWLSARLGARTDPG